MTRPDDLNPAASLETAKAGVRSRLRAQRRARRDGAAVAEGLAATALLAPPVRAVVARSATLALYSSRPGEPGTALLRARLLHAGVRVLLPVVLTGSRLDWIEDDGVVAPGLTVLGSVPGGLGAEALAEADLALIPALAADTTGRRLGQGGGYYDRALATIRPPLVVAVVHDEEVFDGVTAPLPVGPHDLPVDAVLTPTRYFPLPGS